MTKKEQEYLDGLQAYLDQRLSNLKGYLASGVNAMLLSYHTQALEEAKTAIVEENQQRIQDIEKYKNQFKDSPGLMESMIKSTNSSFNMMLRTRETLANIHYRDCVTNGLKVEKIDLSAFKVDENDGL